MSIDFSARRWQPLSRVDLSVLVGTACALKKGVLNILCSIFYNVGEPKRTKDGVCFSMRQSSYIFALHVSQEGCQPFFFFPAVGLCSRGLSSALISPCRYRAKDHITATFSHN